MRQFKPLPQNLELAPTLARRIHQLRELRNLTLVDLSKQTRFTIERIQELESGFETWLSAPDRQRLATALSVQPELFKEVERRSGLEESQSDRQREDALVEAILSGQPGLLCPQCGQTLKTSVQEALDIEERPTKFAKAFCPKCPFIIKQ